MTQSQHQMPANNADEASGPGSAAETADSQSALRMTRDAIARWRGMPLPAASLPRGITRISPQARWLERAHSGLQSWIARGGFADPEPQQTERTLALSRPVRYRLGNAHNKLTATQCPELEISLNRRGPAVLRAVR